MNRNCMDLTEAEDIKKRWQEYTERKKVKSLSRVQLLQPHGLFGPRDFPGKCTGVRCHFFIQEYIEELYKKNLHAPDNHHCMITHLEPDILECEVKRALESIIVNKASEGNEFQLSYFKS